jgi:hypothetical protein
MTDAVMAESKPRKPGLLRRILWGLWVILLMALLVLGLVFAVPWKVITLIAIFLAAATILPGIYRKWFWAAVGLAVIIFAGWVLAPTDHEGWEQYKYDFSSQLAKLEQERAIPPAENAATDYLALLKEDASDDANLTDRFYKVYNSPWKSSEHPDAAKSLEKHSQTIAELMDISKKPECRFPLNNPDRPYFDIPRHMAITKYAYLLAAACNNDIGEGRIEQALEKIAVIVQIGRHQIQQGTRVGMLFGIGIKLQAYSIVRSLIMNGLDEEKLSIIQNTICTPVNEWENAWPIMLEYEKLVAVHEIASYYEINKNGQIRISRDPQWPERIRFRKTLNEPNKSDVNDSSNQYKKLFSPFIYKMAYPSWSETKLLRAETFILWLCLPAIPDDIFAFIKKKTILTTTMLQDPTHETMVQTYQHSMAERKGTLIMVALKHYKNAHGNWPENLTEIKSLALPDTFIDPLNNGKFVYKRTANGFILYSKGKNGIDEEGQFGGKTSPDDWMIWPYKSKVSKQQEQKANEQKE